jgi:hypothetical protein
VKKGNTMTQIEIGRWTRWLATEIKNSPNPDTRADELRRQTAPEWQIYVDRARQYVRDVFSR